MTYIGKREHFRCDLCGKVEAAEVFPRGWIWYKTGGPVAHACGDCKSQIPERDHRHPGQKN